MAYTTSFHKLSEFFFVSKDEKISKYPRHLNENIGDWFGDGDFFGDRCGGGVGDEIKGDGYGLGWGYGQGYGY
jgi:hypothetical protein